MIYRVKMIFNGYSEELFDFPVVEDAIGFMRWAKVFFNGGESNHDSIAVVMEIVNDPATRETADDFDGEAI